MRLSRLAVVMIGAFVLAACGSSASPGASAVAVASPGTGDTCPEAPGGTTATGAVEIRDFAYAPASVTVKAGEAVTWTNADTASHTATTLDGRCNTGSIAKGQAVTLVFKQAGTYQYHCNIHASMPTATIEVSS